MDSWRRHQNLWKLDKHAILEKFKVKDPAHSSFEEKLAKYSKLARDIWSQAKDFDQGFIRVSCHALAASVREEALAWVKALYTCMRELDLETIAAMHEKMDAYRVILYKVRCSTAPAAIDSLILSHCLHLKPPINSHFFAALRFCSSYCCETLGIADAVLLRHPLQNPETLEDLKEVLSVITTIRNEGMVMELKYTDLEERFSTRIQYAQGEDLAQFQGETHLPREVRSRWESLTDEADIVDNGLDESKMKFTDTTKQQVKDFAEYTAQFLVSGRLGCCYVLQYSSRCLNIADLCISFLLQMPCHESNTTVSLQLGTVLNLVENVLVTEICTCAAAARRSNSSCRARGAAAWSWSRATRC